MSGISWLLWRGVGLPCALRQQYFIMLWRNAKPVRLLDCQYLFVMFLEFSLGKQDIQAHDDAHCSHGRYQASLTYSLRPFPKENVNSLILKPRQTHKNKNRQAQTANI